jgi:ABC-type glycerol-3-phosphate transport system substrate-binding protein
MRRRLVALGLAGSLILAACGDDDDTTETGDDGDGESSAIEAPPEDTEATLRVWVNGPDTPQEMRDMAEELFQESYPNVEVEFEEQEWDTIVERLANVLPTNDSPDVVEMGNTQAQQFEAAGALVDLSEFRDELGGDDLSDNLSEAGTYDDKFYGVPLYAGAWVVTYRTDLFDASGLEVPTTMEDFIAAGEQLQADNADTPNFSGVYFPGRFWLGMLPYIWDAGGDIAVQNDDGEWEGQLSSSESVEGLETIQHIMQNANQAPADANEAEAATEFCNGEIGMLLSPGWMFGLITDEENGCPDVMGDKLGAFPLPGAEDDVAPTFLGGSVLGISAQSENPGLALEFMKVITGEEFQSAYAEHGLLPARKSLLDLVGGSEAAEAQATAAQITRFTPSSEHWAEVEAADILHDMGTAISEGADVEEEAQRADQAIEEILNG